jgi:hypothetical protein
MIEQTLNFVRARKQQRKEPGRDVLARQGVVHVPVTNESAGLRQVEWGEDKGSRSLLQAGLLHSPFLRPRMEWIMDWRELEGRRKPSQRPKAGAAAASYAFVLSAMWLLLRPVG